MVRRWGAITMLVVAVLTGCGPKTDRLPISGTVSLDGAPLDSGTVSFASRPGEKLQSTGALILQGEYSIPAEKGLLPGVYLLQISSPDADAKPILLRTEPGGPAFAVAPDRIPAAYNVESDKTIEVTQEGENEFNFEIMSDSK